MPDTVFPRGNVRGTVRVPGDKSISHRALILGAVAPGTTRITGLNSGADVRATLDGVSALGATVDSTHDRPDAGAGFESLHVSIQGGSLHDPPTAIDARNSGTTARLLMGLCAGRGITATFDGDASLRRRPMERVARPLRAMGATVQTTHGGLPVTLRGISAPSGGTFSLELPSAQVKSALLLANLNARSDVTIVGDARSRDHTERMLRRFGRDIAWDGESVTLRPGELRPADIDVPGDLSAAAFFIAAAIVTPESDVLVRGVGVNPTRTGVLDALAAMGADIALENKRDVHGEPVADIRARSSKLHGTELRGDAVVRAIDEIPVFAVAAAFASGSTHVDDAADLRTKESDRIAAIAEMLRACGGSIDERPDGFRINPAPLRAPSAALPTRRDHRIAMAAAVLAAAVGPIAVDDAACAEISFPGFVPLWSGSIGTTHVPH